MTPLHKTQLKTKHSYNVTALLMAKGIVSQCDNIMNIIILEMNTGYSQL